MDSVEVGGEVEANAERGGLPGNEHRLAGEPHHGARRHHGVAGSAACVSGNWGLGLPMSHSHCDLKTTRFAVSVPGVTRGQNGWSPRLPRHDWDQGYWGVTKGEQIFLQLVEKWRFSLGSPVQNCCHAPWLDRLGV